jgi:hypothetical protein
MAVVFAMRVIRMAAAHRRRGKAFFQLINSKIALHDVLLLKIAGKGSV